MTNRYSFFGLVFRNQHIVFNGDLSKYGQGETFWRSLQNLADALKAFSADTAAEETPMDRRIRMFQETGINRIEIFVEKRPDGFWVRCTNSSFRVKAADEIAALREYIDKRAQTSRVNDGTGQ